MRVVSWNIRAGGGRRAAAIAAQLVEWRPDVVVLGEFRATPPSVWLAAALGDLGLRHQALTTDAADPARNALLVASRWPLRQRRVRAAPGEPGKWALVRVDSPLPFHLGAMHIPNEVTRRKWPFMEAFSATAAAWRAGPALFIGDTNSGRSIADEENAVFGPRYDAWFDGLARARWTDAFRHAHGARREFTWYAPNSGNGFRIDQAFVNRAMLPRLRAVAHAWGASRESTRRDALSDHAALIVDFSDD